ncbi:MAG: DUF4838 domain-containing protein [Verrucomicrobia bacterium]|nr:DUF4838 domain-containing protein [Verrucomicrobiota bacterium]
MNRRDLLHLGLALLLVSTSSALDIVKDGKPVATVVVLKEQPAASTPAKAKLPRDEDQWDDGAAARVLVDWIKKMTDAELPLAETAPTNTPAIFVGAAAGLRLDDIQSASNEGLRIVADDQRVLIGGQTGLATAKAVCRFLEEAGCRYFMEGAMGEVYLRMTTFRVGKLDITEKPGVVYRRIWGSNWSGVTLWKIWNGSGGLPLETSHSWGRYVSEALAKEHPEYFAMREGMRKTFYKNKQGKECLNDWVCTSNPDLRAVFANNVIKTIQEGTRHPSLSPPDGVEYCECPACKAQDDPRSIEPSSGRVNVSNRYVNFFDDIAQRVAKAAPDSILNFYCYADYTQAPTNGRKLPPNLCAWLAPIRYCRLHRTGSPNCLTRVQMEQMVDGWTAVANKLAYRTYNYNLAEVTVPFSLLSVWKHDLPYLKKKGCIGYNLETLAGWEVCGPHIYLSIRLAYNPDADADAIMDDYFARFYGPNAGPFMKQYWMGIDEAFANLNAHAGSFFAVHLVYTPEFIAKSRALLDKATEAAKSDTAYSQRVVMHIEGFQNADQYIQIREAMNRGDFAQAKRTYDELLARAEAHVKAGYGAQYTVSYLKRFIGKVVDAGATTTAPPNRMLQVLPDRWRFSCDEADQGITNGWHKAEFDDSPWQEVVTFSNTLEAQGVSEKKTILWYRTTFRAPEKHGKLSLFFAEVDGLSEVYINGKKLALVGSSEPQAKARTPFEVDATDAVRSGDNVVAVRVDHSKITELFLGGILRPVMLVEKGN